MKTLFQLLLILLCAAPACAQLGAGSVPDLSAFAGAIAESASAAPSAPPPGRGLFTSGLAVPTVAPGTAARAIGAQLRTTLEAKAGPNPAFAQLESGMPAVLSSVEGALEKQGFAKHDLGVAMAYTFLFNYETATRTKIPDQPSLVAARTIARAIAIHWGPSYQKLTARQKEDMYESLLVSTTLLSAFAEQFDKAGKTADADTMRMTAAQMFTKLIGTAPAQVTIGPDGRISGLVGSGAAAPPVGTTQTPPDVPPGGPQAKVPGTHTRPTPTHAAGGAAVKASLAPAAASLSASVADYPATYISRFRPTHTPAEFLRMGFKEKIEMVPDEFGCFLGAETPPHGDLPDITVHIIDHTTYEANAAGKTSSGTYRIKKGNGLMEVVWTSGLFKSETDSWVANRHWGQELTLRSFKSNFHCYEKGPGVERGALERARVSAQPGEYSCASAAGQTSVLRLNEDGTYTTAQGTGQVKSTVFYNTGWEGGLTFTSGPIGKATAVYKEDATGLRTIHANRDSSRQFAGGLTTIAQSSTELTCSAHGPARPYAAYGPDRVPAPSFGTSASHSVDGFYFKLGIISIGGFAPIDQYAFFTRSGWYTEDDPDTEAFDIDCTRTRPNGEPRCKPYQVQGGNLLIEGEKPQTFKAWDTTGLEIDGQDFFKTYTIEGRHPTGHFQAFSAYSSGVGIMNTGGGSFSSDLYLQPDGSFSRESASTFSYSNGNQVSAGEGVLVTANSNSSKRATGMARFHGYTAEFVYPDGRIERSFAYTTAKPGAGPVDLLEINGSKYLLDDK